MKSKCTNFDVLEFVKTLFLLNLMNTFSHNERNSYKNNFKIFTLLLLLQTINFIKNLSYFLTKIFIIISVFFMFLICLNYAMMYFLNFNFNNILENLNDNIINSIDYNIFK